MKKTLAQRLMPKAGVIPTKVVKDWNSDVKKHHKKVKEQPIIVPENQLNLFV